MPPLPQAKLLQVASRYNLFHGFEMWRNVEALTTYVELSLKAGLWRKRYGVEGTKRLMPCYFMPLGAAVPVVVMLAALRSLSAVATAG